MDGGEDAGSVLEGQHWAAHETPLSCQVEVEAARPGVRQRDLGERQVSTLAHKNTGVGYHFLLQGIFPTQGSNPGLPHCRQTL